MKLFSRKAIAAVATSVALTTAGLSAPAFAAEGEQTVSSSSSTADAGQNGGNKESSSEGQFEGSSNEQGVVDPKNVSAWIGVLTAIISALSAGFLFIQRING